MLDIPIRPLKSLEEKYLSSACASLQLSACKLVASTIPNASSNLHVRRPHSIIQHPSENLRLKGL